MSDDEKKWTLTAEGDWLAGQSFEIGNHSVLGRDSSCDITIPGTHLSRQHAELAVKDGRLLIRDLDSSNGTFLNDKQITEASLNPGDVVRFDVLTFKVDGPSESEKEPDANATKVRVVQPAAKKKPPPKPVSDKNWKTKPSSVGNRHDTMQISTSQKASKVLINSIAIMIGLAALAGIGYLITYL